MGIKCLQQHPQFNFQLKFLKFKKWCLDGYEIMSHEYPLEKPGYEEGFRGPCWLGEQTSAMSNISVKTICFQKAEGLRGG